MKRVKVPQNELKEIIGTIPPDLYYDKINVDLKT